MANELLERLQGIDPAVLTEVVRKAQHNSTLEIQNWTVEPLGGGGADCVFRISGLASHQRWAVVAKYFPRPAPENEPHGEWPIWQKEILALQSDELNHLPAGIRIPHNYGTTESENGVWLWLENIQETTPRKWPLAIFRRTARLLGRFNAGYLAGRPLPVQPWFNQPFLRSLWGDDGWVRNLADPTIEGIIWQAPKLQEIIDAKRKERIFEWIAERNRFLNANDRLPQVLCHNDAQRRNFIWTHAAHSDQEELVMIDWEFNSLGALGNDLGQLIGNSMWFFEYDPFEAQTLERALLDSYLDGIADQKVDIDPRLVRLGCLISISIWMGANIPPLIYFQLPENEPGIIPLFGRKKEDLVPGWQHLNAYGLDCADEARRLIKDLGL